MKIREYKPGERLKVPKNTYVTGEHEEHKVEEVTVVQQYPNHVLVKNEKGTRWCITNGELYVMECKKKAKDEEKP